MLEAGFPCPGCNAARFRSAVEKAERVHGLVSASDAIFVRWVREPASLASSMFWRALLFFVLCLLLALAASWLLGSLAWHYGLGLGRGMGPGAAAALGPWRDDDPRGRKQAV
mmetsp:Transcript_69092/g.213691  ORF Transcript_69092/g.213691 Transcript_69092/m.213691 type:complete len:112 (+) Transcript_69092:145-480(+)